MSEGVDLFGGVPPGAAPTEGSDLFSGTYTNPYAVPPAPRTTTDDVLATGAGAAAGAGLAGLLYGLKRALPGGGTKGLVTKNVLERLDRAFKAKDADTSILKELRKYEAFRKTAGNDINFPQWVALQGNADVSKAVTDILAHSGKAADVGAAMRPLRTDAKPEIRQLYNEAFANRSPLWHTDIGDYLSRNEEVVKAALRDAEESFKFDPDKRITLADLTNVPIGKRKDDWRREAFRTVPEYLYYGDPKAGLQKAIVPNLETFDRMKRAMWTLAEKRAREGAGDVGAIHRARSELTRLLDQYGPEQYRQARMASMEDFEREAAEKLGEKLAMMNPTDVASELGGMAPHELRSAAQGAGHRVFGRQLPPTTEGKSNAAELATLMTAIRSGIGDKFFGMPLTMVKPGWPSRRASRIGAEWMLDPSEAALTRGLERAAAIPNMGERLTGAAGLGAIGGYGAGKYYGPNSGGLNFLGEEPLPYSE